MSPNYPENPKPGQYSLDDGRIILGSSQGGGSRMGDWDEKEISTQERRRVKPNVKIKDEINKKEVKKNN